MTLFATAFRMGIEPFFFSIPIQKPSKAYAQKSANICGLGSR